MRESEELNSKQRKRTGIEKIQDEAKKRISDPNSKNSVTNKILQVSTCANCPTNKCHDCPMYGVNANDRSKVYKAQKDERIKVNKLAAEKFNKQVEL